MAELLEVLVLRMENCEQQQQEVSQLRTQVTKLQQCCQLVRRGGTWGSLLQSWPCATQGVFFLPLPSGALSSAGPKDPVQVRVGVGGDLRELPTSCPFIPRKGPRCSRNQAI